MHVLMASFPDQVWFLLAIVAGGAVLGMLHTFAAQARNEIARHDLKIEVRRLQHEYTRRLAELAGPKPAPDADEVGEVDVLEDEDEDAGGPASEGAGAERAEAADPERAPETAGRVAPGAETGSDPSGKAAA